MEIDIEIEIGTYLHRYIENKERKKNIGTGKAKNFIAVSDLDLWLGKADVESVEKKRKKGGAGARNTQTRNNTHEGMRTHIACKTKIKEQQIEKNTATQTWLCVWVGWVCSSKGYWME